MRIALRVGAILMLGLIAWKLLEPATQRSGHAYRDRLADAYAAKLLLMADALERGHSDLPSLVNEGEEEFRRYREHYFNEYLLPHLERAAGGKDIADDPASRQRVARTLRDLAMGLSPYHVPLPPGPDPGPEPEPKPEPKPEPEPDAAGKILKAGPTGWIDRPEEREQIIATMPNPSLAQAAPDFFRENNDTNVFLYRAWKEVLGDYPSYPSQQIGDCTSFGSSHALDLLQCIDIKVYHLDKASYKETSTEATYGQSREQAGLLHSRGDGCFGAATAKALTDHGTVSREFVGAQYSGDRAKQWGYAGCPEKIKAEAIKHRLGGATLITTTNEADAALNNGYPFIICSNQGFTLRRDESGACAPRGTWPHCMFVAGRRRRGADVQYLICQSWGSDNPTGPTTDDQPPFSFWCDHDTMAHILAARDSFVFSRFAGFARRPLPERWRFSGFAVHEESRPDAKAVPDPADTPPERPDDRPVVPSASRTYFVSPPLLDVLHGIPLDYRGRWPMYLPESAAQAALIPPAGR